MRILIHAGGLSLDNGAWGPRKTYFDLAKAIGVSADVGECDGSDAIEIEDSDWPVVESILVESKMLYKVQGVHFGWQNAQTDSVRAQVNLSHRNP